MPSICKHISVIDYSYNIITVQVDGFTFGSYTEYGGTKAVLDGYTSVYTIKLESISGNDIHYWHGIKEAFVAKPQVKHLKGLFPKTNVEVFKGLNHGQLLIDYPEEVAKRIIHNQKTFLLHSRYNAIF